MSIRNFRSIESLDLEVDDYTAFVGVNGAGKSSVLYAVDWMLNGRVLSEADVHALPVDGDADSEEPLEAKAVSVELTFADLTQQDRVRLEKYGRGDTLTVRKTWAGGDPKPKMIGKSLQGPGFVEVRSAASIGDARVAFAALREVHEDLGEPGRLPKAPELEALMSAWEDDPANKDKLVAVEDDDASNFFGFDGQNRLKQCIRMVLVPAASDISSEVAGTKKGSAIADLLGVLMTNASTEAREAWVTKHAEAIDELTVSMREKVAEATGLEAVRINKRLGALVPNSTVQFTPEIPNWVPSPTPVVATDVSVDGITHDVARQGHGVQRAVMIAMFQSLAPDEDLAERDHAQEDDETEAAAQERLAKAKLELPALLVCIEEPEVYQHPIRARAFARVLAELADQPRVQVMLATHSPYFVPPAKFEAIRRFTLAAGCSALKSTTVDEVAVLTVGAGKEEQVRKAVSQKLSSTFSEAFFAEKVVLVEGDTDKAVLEEVAKKLGLPFDSAGISIVDVSGKQNLRIPNGILTSLDIDTYVVADADALGHNRVAPENQASNEASHRASTDKLVAWLPPGATPRAGTVPFVFGQPTVVTDKYTLWLDDLEHELQQWPSFVAAQTENGHSPRSKNMLAYLTDVEDADLADLPVAIKSLVYAIHGMPESAPST